MQTAGNAMEKYISKAKMSKKAQRELDRKKRRTWGALSPVTRRPENPKAYNRKKAQRGDDCNHQPAGPFDFHSCGAA